MEALARSFAMDGVRFHGRLGPGPRLEVLRRAGYLVFPSQCYETFGRAVIEAFAAGRAVVAARHGAALELVDDGCTGLLFEAGNADDLGRRVAWLEAHPEAVRTLGRNARRAWERRFTPERNLAMLRNVYGLARRRFKQRFGGERAGRAPAFAMEGEAVG
jgi:glycosyltransferase involved in cell wall biosynthesis